MGGREQLGKMIQGRPDEESSEDPIQSIQAHMNPPYPTTWLHSKPLFLFICSCVDVCTYMFRSQCKQEDGITSPGAGDTGHRELRVMGAILGSSVRAASSELLSHLSAPDSALVTGSSVVTGDHRVGWFSRTDCGD